MVAPTNAQPLLTSETYQLPNGLTVILHEDHSDPVVYVEVNYGVGGANDPKGKSGIAHFFEHLMFDRGDKQNPKWDRQTVTESGGTFNGLTYFDQTLYSEFIPKHYLERMLCLEANRMSLLLDGISDEELESEKSIVKNEYKQRYENRPLGMLKVVTSKNLYPPEHPYHDATIGKMEELEGLTHEDIEQFFLKYYSPNNAFITIAGNIEPRETMQWVKKYFGKIPKRSSKQIQEQPHRILLNQNRYVSYQDPHIQHPTLIVTFPTVSRFHPDEAALDILGELLAGKNGGLISDAVRRQGMVGKVMHTHVCRRLDGDMTMRFNGNKNAVLSKLWKTTSKSLDTLSLESFDVDAINKVKQFFELNQKKSLMSVAQKGRMLSEYYRYSNGVMDFTADLKRYQDVEAKDVYRVYKKYIKGKHALVISWLDDLSTLPAMDKNYAPPIIELKPDTTVISTDILKTGWPRADKPGIGKLNPIKPLKIWVENIANGLKIAGHESQEAPLVSFRLTLEGGKRLEPVEGLAKFVVNMLNERKIGGQTLKQALNKYGSSIKINSFRKQIRLELTTMSKHFAASMVLLDKYLFQPSFDLNLTNKVKESTLEKITSKKGNQLQMAVESFFQILYGDNAIAGYGEGKTETVNKISVVDVVNFYDQFFRPNQATLSIVGNITKDEVLAHTGFLSAWEKSKRYDLPTFVPPSSITKTAVYLYDQKSTSRSIIFMGKPLNFSYDVTGKFFSAQLMNDPFGWAFLNNRITRNLRDQRGWAYSAYTYLNSYNENSQIYTYANVGTQHTDSTVAEIIKEYKNYQANGITPEELKTLKRSFLNRSAMQYESFEKKAEFLESLIRYGFPADYPQQQLEIVQNITKEEIDALASEYLDVNTMFVYVSGNKEKVLPGLKRLGYEIIEVDEYGERIGQLYAP